MTRDSLLFSWFAVIAAVLTYLGTAGDPRAWDFPHWINAISAIAGIVAAKLGTSPLQGSPSTDTVKTPALPR